MVWGNIRPKARTKKDEYCRQAVIFKRFNGKIFGVALGAPLLELEKYYACYLRLCSSLDSGVQKWFLELLGPGKIPPSSYF